MTHAERLERAVACIYPDIRSRVASSQTTASETVLWKELSCCILSSQVKYSLAVAAAERLEQESLLSGPSKVCEIRLENALRLPVMVEDRLQRYRFPQVKARQLSATHRVVHTKARGLSALLESFSDPEESRSWFVTHAAGVGPKQASMFLRNTGMSYDLAVLDRHVVDYMDEIGLSSKKTAELSSLSAYTRREHILRSYAAGLGMAVGLLDWAIWIVMRAFKEREIWA